MSATHLKWDPISEKLATGLPVKVTVQACTKQGDVDTSKNGKLSLLVCKSLCDDTFGSRTLHAWTSSTDARASDGLTCDVIAKYPGEGDPETTHCLQVKGGVGDAKMDRNWARGAKRSLGSIKPTRVGFHVKTNTAEHETGVMFLTDTSERVCTVFALRKGGKMGIEDELIHFPTHVQTDYKAHRWYSVNMLFDWSSQVFDLVVDGLLIASRIPFEDHMVMSLGYVYIANSHEDSETLWGRFECTDECSVPSMELDGQAYLSGGIWQGYISFEDKAEKIFLRAHLEQDKPAPTSPTISPSPPSSPDAKPLRESLIPPNPLNTTTTMPAQTCEEDREGGRIWPFAQLQGSPSSTTRVGQLFEQARVGHNSSSSSTSVRTLNTCSSTTPTSAASALQEDEEVEEDEEAGSAAQHAHSSAAAAAAAAAGAERLAQSSRGDAHAERNSPAAAAAAAGASAGAVHAARADNARLPYAMSARMRSSAQQAEDADALALLQARYAPFCSGLYEPFSAGLTGRSLTFSLHHLEKPAIRAGNDTALTRDMLGLLDDPDISDLTLIVEGRKIYVHRALLYARSAHFKNMFSSGMRECEEREVHIADTSYDTVKVMLTYLYTGDAALTPASAFAVMELADRYMLYGLVRLCEAHLLKAVRLETVLSILVAAKRYSAAHLSHVCVEFAVDHFQELVDTVEYAALDPAIMLLVQRAVAPHVMRTMPLKGDAREMSLCPAGRSSVRDVI